MTALILSLLVLNAAPAHATGELSQSFTMDGKLFADNNGTAPLSDTGILKIQILDPAQTCVLYEETQPFDVTQSEGFFHATIGSVPGAPKRNGTSGLDSSNAMATVYSNINPAGIGGRSLAGGGCTFVPASGDARFLRVTVITNRDGQSRTLSPNLTLDSVPAAIVAERAETLRGLTPNAFLQLDTPGNTNLTQANVESVFQSLPALQALLGGSSPSYMQSGTGTAASLPQPTTPPTNASASASEGQIWYDSTSHSIRYSDGSAVQTIGVSGAGITSLAIGNGLQSTAGSNVTHGGETISVNSGTGANQVVQLDSGARYPAADGSLIKGINASNLTGGTIGNGVVVNTSGAVTSSSYVAAPELRATSVKIFNGANYVEQRAPASLSSDYALTWPVALPGSGTNQVLTADSTGQLTWIDLNSGLVSNQASLANGQIWIGDATGKAQARTPSGDVSLSNAGAFRVNAIQNIAVDATAPTTSGQTLRFDLTTNRYVPAFVAMTDLRSKATGTAAFGASCTNTQTLTYDAVTDSMSCQNITVGAGQLGANSVTTATIANDAVTSAKLSSTGIAVNRLVMTDATTGTNFTFATCAPNEILKYGATGWTCATVTSLAPVTSVAGKTGVVTLNAADIGGLGTAALLDHGTAAGQALALDGAARVPAVDGSLLTQVNAVRLQTRDIASTLPTADQVLTWNDNAAAWEPRAVPSAPVQSVAGRTGAVVIYPDDLVSAAGKYLTYLPNAVACANNQTLKWDGARWICANDENAGGDITSVIAGAALVGGGLSGDVTLAVDVGTTANKVVQLNGSAQLPALDGSNLTSVNAAKLQSRAIASTAPTANQILKWNDALSTWAPANDEDNGITATTGDVTAAGPGSAVATIAHNAITSVKINDVGVAVNRLLITDATTGANVKYADTCAVGQVLKWSSTGWLCDTDVGSGGIVTYVGAGTGLLGGPVTSTGTLRVDVGTGATQIVQLNGSAQIPAVDGSLLTSVNAVNIQTRAISAVAPTAGTVLGWNTSANQWEPIIAATGSVQNVAGGLGILGGPITTNGTLSVDIGVTAGKIVQLNPSAQIPAVDGSLVTQINAVKLQTRAVSATAPTAGQVLAFNTTLTQWEPTPAALGSVTNVSGGTGILGGPITSNGTLSVDVGIIAGKILQLNPSAQIPAVDGSLVTQINAVKLQTRAVSATAPTAGQVLAFNTTLTQWEPTPAAVGSVTNVAGGTGILGGPITSNGTLSVDVGSTANKILQVTPLGQLPIVDGSLLTQVNAVKLQTRAISSATPTSGQVLAFNTTLTQWEPSLAAVGSVTNVSSGTGILGGPITTNGTLNVDVGSTANKILQVTPLGQLPIVDGSLLTQVNAVKLQTRSVSSATPTSGQVLAFNMTLTQWEPTPAALGSVTNVTGGTGILGGPITSNGTLSVDVGSTANKILQVTPLGQLPIVDGSLLTQVNAVKLQTRSVSSATPTSGQVLAFNMTLTQWEPTPAALGSVVNVAGGTGILGGPITSNGTLSVDVGSTANKILQVTPLGQLPIVDGSLLTQVNAVKLQTRAVSSAVPTSGQVLAFNTTLTQWEPTPAALGSVTNVTGGTGILGGPITSNGTLSVDVGSTANKILQVTPLGQLPIVDGSQLTQINAVKLQTRPVSVTPPTSGQVLAWNTTFTAWTPFSDLGGSVASVSGGTGILGGPITSNGTLSVDVGSTANKILQVTPLGQLPIVDGSLLTQVNAVKLQTRAISSATPTSGQVLAFNTTLTQWEPTPTALGSVTNVSGGTGILGGPITSNGTLSVDVGSTANKILQVTPLGQLPIVDGSLLTQVNAVKLQTRAVSSAGPTAGQVLAFNMTLTQWEPTPAALGSVTNVSGGTGILGGPITSNGTLAVDVGSTANKILQVTPLGQLPIVDGSLLTQVNAVKLQTRSISSATPTSGQVLAFNTTLTQWEPTPAAVGSVTNVSGGTGILGGPITSNGTLSVDVGSTANKILQLTPLGQLPIVDGSQLTQINAVKLQTRPVSVTPPTSGQVLAWNTTFTAWTPFSDLGGSVVSVSGGTGILGGPITSNGTLSVDVGSTANKILQVTPLGQLPIVDGSLLTQVNAVKLQTRAISSATPTSGQVLAFNTTLTQWEPTPAALGSVTNVSGGTGILGGPITSNGTLSVDVGSTANKILQVTPLGQLPIVDGSLLTQVNAVKLQTRTVSSATPTSGQVLAFNTTLTQWEPTPTTLGSVTNVSGGTGILGGPITSNGTLSVDVGSTANKILQVTPLGQLPIVDGSLLTQVNAVKLQTRAISSATPTSGQVLAFNTTLTQWEPTPTSLGSVTNVSGGIGILGGPITSNGTLSVDVGSTANKILQVTPLGQLPIVDGSLLTQVNAVKLQTRSVSSVSPTSGQVLAFNMTLTQWEPTPAALGSVVNVAGGTGILGGPITSNGTLSVDVGSTANKILQVTPLGQLPIVDGSLLTQVNAVKLQTRAISSATPTSGQVLAFNTTLTQWEPTPAAVGSVTNVAGGLGILGGPITTNGTLSVDVGSAANKIVQENGNAQIAQGLGSTTLPSYTFTGNANTGLYSPGTNQLALTANGSTALTVTAAGNVAIGTNTSSYPLTISTTNPTPLALIQRTAAQNANMMVSNQTYTAYVGLSPTGNFAVGLNNNLDTSPQFAITPAGNVAIGANVASVALDVIATGSGRSAIIVPRDTTGNRPTGVNGMIRYNSSNNAMEAFINGTWQNFAAAAAGAGFLPLGGGTMTGVIQSANGTVGAPGVAFANDATTGLYSTGAGILSLATAGTARLTISATGSLGINTTAPALPLDVNGASIFRDVSSFTSGTTTGTAVGITPTALTSGTGLGLSAANTGFTGTLLNSTYSSTGSGKNTVLSTSNASATGDVLTVTNAGSGLTAKFTGGTGNVVIDNGGEVGIGTLSPGAILDVTAVGANSAIIMPRDTTGNRPTGVNGMIRYNTSNGAVESFVSGQWQNVATGNLYLPLTGGTMTGPILSAPGTVGAPGLAFSNSTSTGMYSTGAGNLTLASVGTARMSINQTGVGFGNANPQYPLDVTGNVFMGSGYFTNIPAAPLNLVNAAGSTMKTQLNLINTAGGAGAGSAIDFFTFDLAGGTNPGLRLSGIDTNYTADFAVSMKLSGAANTALVERMRLTSAGRLGVGTNNPGYPLHVVGDVSTTTQYRVGATVVCTSAGCTSSSDSRLKQNVRPLEDSLDKVLSLNGVTWDWIDKAKYGSGDQVGVIAQDLERVYPEAVVTDPDTDLKSVRYGNLVGPLIEAIKALYDKLTGHDERIKALELENAALKAKVETSERNFDDLKTRLEKLEQR